MSVNDFAIPRGATEPVTSKADRGEGLGTEVPRRNRGRLWSALIDRAETTRCVLTVADFVDRYFTNHIEADMQMPS